MDQEFTEQDFTELEILDSPVLREPDPVEDLPDLDRFADDGNPHAD